MSTKAQSNATMAFIAGLTAGSVIAMLFAPKNGEDTRAEIIDKLNKAKSKSNDAIDTTRSTINKTLDNASGKVQEVANKMQYKTDKAKKINNEYTDTTRL